MVKWHAIFLYLFSNRCHGGELNYILLIIYDSRYPKVNGSQHYRNPNNQENVKET